MTKAADEEERARHRAKMAKRKEVQDAEVAGKTVEKGLLGQIRAEVARGTPARARPERTTP